jgi:hypothetical protein
LYLYCGGPGHIAITCSHKPKRQVNQVSTHKPDSTVIVRADGTRCRGPLSNAEKQRCWANQLCLYCGGPGHIAITCPHKPKRQVNQVSTHKPDLTLIVRANNPSAFSSSIDPCHSNNFNVLSQLDELLNE